MKRLTVVSFLSAILISGIATSACRAGSRTGTPATVTSPDVSTSATFPPSPPQATPTVPPTPSPVLKTAGWLIFLRGHDLWVAKLDGSTERQLTNGSLGAGYAGFTRDSAGRVVLYYTSEIAGLGPEGPPGGGVFEVYKQAVEGGPTLKLFSFRGSMKQVEYSATNASVSPDGLYIAYSDDGGVSSYDLEREAVTRLLTNTPCADISPAGCHGYFNPSWSPRGDWLMAQELFYEGAQFVGVQPLNPTSGVREFAARNDYDAASWSPDGTQLCLVPFNSYRAVKVVTPEGTGSADLEPALRAGLPVADGVRVGAYGCSWSNDGRLAMAYVLSTDQLNPHVAVFDGSSFNQDVPLPPVPGSRLNAFAWLPDGSGFVAAHSPPGALAPDSEIVLLDGTTRSLPFAAHRVLGVIP